MKVGDLLEPLTISWARERPHYSGHSAVQHFSIIGELYPDDEIVEVIRIKTGLSLRYTYGVFSTLFKIL
jgi:hypothetical protein